MNCCICHELLPVERVREVRPSGRVIEFDQLAKLPYWRGRPCHEPCFERAEASTKLPGRLTPERAKEAWLSRTGPDVHDLLTLEEQRAVDTVWATMDRSSRWVDAFFKIMNQQ